MSYNFDAFRIIYNRDPRAWHANLHASLELPYICYCLFLSFYFVFHIRTCNINENVDTLQCCYVRKPAHAYHLNSGERMHVYGEFYEMYVR